LQVPLVGIRGFYQFYDGQDIVYIDSQLPNQVKKFVCAHELGHSLMHKDINAVFLDTCTYLKAGRYERQANQFAINLLYPHDSDFDDYRDLTIQQTARCLNVSEDLVEYRLKEIKKLTLEQ
jgi:Zn-dependent peptidase ImmA (M78 family)